MLQYDFLRRCVGAVKGAGKEKVRKIVGVERVSTYLDGVQDRFVARALKEKYQCGMVWEGGLQHAPRIEGHHPEFDTTMDYVAEKTLVPLMGEIMLGAIVQKVDIPVIDLGVSEEAPGWGWEEVIEWAMVGHIRIYTDGCKDADGAVGRAWWRSNGKFGGRRMGTRATVSDGEVAGIEDGIWNCPRGLVWILSDSKLVIAAMVNTGRTSRASTGSLANAVAGMVYTVCRRGEGAVKLSWVKVHGGIVGNEEADNRAGWCTSHMWERTVMEGGIRAYWKELWRAERECEGFGCGRAVECGRKALSYYTHTRTSKGKIGHWREVVGHRDVGCRRSGANVEDGAHVAFHCEERAEGQP